MARRKARRMANSSEQRIERIWTGHRRAWAPSSATAEKMPLRLSGRTGDPSPSRRNREPFLGSDDAPAENSARRSRATWSHPFSSSTSPSPQPSPWVNVEIAGRENVTGVSRRRRWAAERRPPSTNDMAGKTSGPAEVESLPLAPPRARSSQSAARPPPSLHHPALSRRGAQRCATGRGRCSGT